MDNYVVKKGDTLTNIANKFGVSINAIKDANDMVDENIVTGDVLVIPKQEDIYDYYKVKENDTLYKIARLNNTTTDILKQINGIGDNDYLYPNETIFIPKKGLSFYITKEGDSIGSVSDYFNISSEELVKDNVDIYLVKDQLILYKK